MTFITVFSKTLTGNSDIWEGRTHVQIIPSGTIGAAETFRLTFDGATTKPTGVQSMYIGERGAGDAYDFAVTPVPVLVGGISTFDIPQGGSVVSDEITLSFDGTKDLVIATSFKTDSAKGDIRTLFGSGVGASYYFKNRANDAATVNKTGYDSAGNNPNALGMISKIEVIRPVVVEPEPIAVHPMGFYETPSGVDARLVERVYAPTYDINNPRNFQRIVHLAIPDCQPGDVITAFSSWAFTLDFNITTEVSSGLVLTPDPTGTAGIQDIVGNQFAIGLGDQPSNGVFVSRFPGRNLTLTIHHDFHNHNGIVEVPEGMSGTLYLAVIAYADASDHLKYIKVEPHSCFISAKVEKVN